GQLKMLFSIACLIACRLIRNHFAVPVREVAMLTSSSCRTRVCCARSVLCCWRAGRSLVGGVRLGPSLNLWALPCLPRAAVWSCACSVVLRDAGPPLARRGGPRHGVVVKCPAPTAVEGAGLSVRLSPLWGGAADGSRGQVWCPATTVRSHVRGGVRYCPTGWARARPWTRVCTCLP